MTSKIDVIISLLISALNIEKYTSLKYCLGFGQDRANFFHGIHKGVKPRALWAWLGC